MMLQNLVSPSQKTPARAALEECPIGVAIVDARTQQRLFVNQALADMFEAGSAAELLAGDIRKTWPDQAELERILEQFEDGRHLNNYEAERVTLSSRPIWLLMNTQCLSFYGKAARLVWHGL